MKQLVKLAIEIGPLILFFLTNAKAGIFVATQVFMVAIVISLSLSYYLDRRIAIMPLVTGVVVLVFGGLTIYLENDLFIKLKPTIVNSLFAMVLLGGLAFGKSFLSTLFNEVFQLQPEGWRILTLRWGLFFIALAIINEIVWRNFSTDFWVSFKVFGIMPLTMVFALSQFRVLNKYQILPDQD
jgi:intracellular septation protein